MIVARHAPASEIPGLAAFQTRKAALPILVDQIAREAEELTTAMVLIATLIRVVARVVISRR